jgi:hypothetical protein
MAFVLMISGMAIVFAALLLFPSLGLRYAFVVAGLAIEVLGLGLFADGYKSEQTPRQR